MQLLSFAPNDQGALGQRRRAAAAEPFPPPGPGRNLGAEQPAAYASGGPDSTQAGYEEAGAGGACKAGRWAASDASDADAEAGSRGEGCATNSYACDFGVESDSGGSNAGADAANTRASARAGAYPSPRALGGQKT